MHQDSLQYKSLFLSSRLRWATACTDATSYHMTTFARSRHFQDLNGRAEHSHYLDCPSHRTLSTVKAGEHTWSISTDLLWDLPIHALENAFQPVLYGLDFWARARNAVTGAVPHLPIVVDGMGYGRTHCFMLLHALSDQLILKITGHTDTV